MIPPEGNFPHCLRPYDTSEGISLKEAAALAGKKETTLRNWANQHGLGRRVGGGTWVFSIVALTMFLDGDEAALKAYLSGDRSGALVSSYFDRCGVPLEKLRNLRIVRNDRRISRVRIATAQ